MKRILLWDQRFPDRAPTRLNLDDGVASACVRAGVATAADPADAGALAAGVALSAANPVETILQHGAVARVSRVVLPLAVAQVAIAAGLAALPSGSTIVSATPLAALLAEDGSLLLAEDGSPLLAE